MAKLPDNHILAARGLHQVQAILARSDALSEVIQNDYGEDLIVQTRNGKEADNFQILIQVKAVSNPKKKHDKFKVRLQRNHLYRWVARIGTVLVCVYDDSTREVFAFDPAHKFSLWDLLSSRSETLQVEINSGDLFTEDRAPEVIWASRIRHYSNLLAIAENNAHYLRIHQDNEDVTNAAHRQLPLISLIFLKSVGIIIGDSFSDSFRKIVRRGAPYFQEEFLEADLSLREVVMFALIGDVNEATKCGVPSNIMEQACEACGHFYKSFHREEWDEAESHMPNIWIPYGGIQSNPNFDRQ